VWLLEPLEAGIAILVLLGLFSAASGVGSVSYQDVIAKTVDRGRRGSLLGQRASIGGITTLFAAVAIIYGFGPDTTASAYLILIAAAAALWIGAGAFFAAIGEHPGAKEGGRNLIGELGAGFKAFRTNGVYRHYLFCRAALIGPELAIPFYVLASQREGESLFASLGALMFATGLAHFVSSPVWGRVSDKSGRLAMGGAGVASAIAAAGTLAAIWVGGSASVWFFAPVIFVAAVAEAGARTGRKTYLVDGAPDGERPLYVAFGNSLTGIVMLAGGLLGVLADSAGLVWTLAAIFGLSLLGALLAAALPPAEEMAAAGE
jgi:predicted MFS family arabinose efflux permease